MSTSTAGQADDVLAIANGAIRAPGPPLHGLEAAAAPSPSPRPAVSWTARLICWSGIHSFEHALHQRRYVCRHCGRTNALL